MELAVLLLSVVITSLCVVLLKLINVKRCGMLPPSPGWGLPVIGHLHLLGRLPHQSLQTLALKHDGLMLLKLGNVKMLVVSSPGFAKEIIKTNDHVFASRPSSAFGEYMGYEGAGISFAKYGKHWRSMRKFCTMELLTSKRVELSQPVRRFEVFLLLKQLFLQTRAGLAVDLTTKLSDLTFNIMLRMVMNRSSSGDVDPVERDEALRMKQKIIEAFTIAGTSIGEFLPWLKFLDNQVSKMKAIRQFLDAFLDKEIARHRKQSQETPKDFMDVILSLGEPMSDDSIKSLSMDMMGGGTDTAAVTLDWAIAELVKCPQLLKRAQEELDAVVGKERLLEENDLPSLSFLKAVVKETLRLHPPGPLLIPHESTQPCRVGSYEIPAGTRAVINVYAIGRDPAFWEEPCKFNPDRFLNSDIDVKGQSFEYLPFGSGRRSCPGILLGMTTVQLVLASLLHTFEWSLPVGESAHDLDMSEGFGLTVPRSSPLKLVPRVRLSTKVYESLITSATVATSKPRM